MFASLMLSQVNNRPPNFGTTQAGSTISRSPARMEASVDHAYWLRRESEELAVAGSTMCDKARLIHLDLASRYSVKAADALA